MGNGQTNARAATEEHLRKWEAALAALEKVSNSGRCAMERDRVYASGAEDVRSGNEEGFESSMRGVCRSSQVSFSTTAGGSESSGPEHQATRRQNHTPNESNGRSWGTNASGNTSNTHNAEHSRTGSFGGHHKSRQQVVECRKARMAFFKSCELQNDDEAKPTMDCGHFGAVAVALSYLLGGPRGCEDRRKCVTVEDIFFTVHLPLHYLHSGTQTLQVMTDILREFIEVDNRFKSEYGLSVVHFDISPVVGQVEPGGNEVGDRQRCMQLHEFTKAISSDGEEQTQAIRIVNYDPYVLEQEALVGDFVDGEEDISALADSIRVGLKDLKRHYSKNNRGMYAVIVEVRYVVQLMVTLAEGIVDDELHVRLFEVPAAALFKAMTVPLENERARGFMRIFRKDSVPVMTHTEVRSMFSPELAGGNVLGTTSLGIHASAVSGHTSPHIIAVAWAMHLLGGDRPGAHGHGNGLPVSDIVRTLRFPAEVLIDGTMPLGEVFKYAREYIRLTNRNYDVHIYPILTTTLREDAVPTTSVFELESILTDVRNANRDPDSPDHVMVIMYNGNVAHNVLYISNTPQWCVLSGYDQESQMVSLIDAHPKKFMKQWTCSLERLHRAMTTNGYLVFSKRAAVPGPALPKDKIMWNDSPLLGCESSVRRVGALTRMEPTVQRYLELLANQETLGANGGDIVKTLCFPSLPLSPTMIALTLTKLGYPTTFEDVVIALPFEISSLMLRYFTLESMVTCLTTYVERAGLNISVKVYHTDMRNGDIPRVTVEEFQQAIEECLADSNKALVMLFNANEIEVFGGSRPFGSTGVVVGYNKATGGVVVMDTNPNRYFRTWSVCLHILFRAMHDLDTIHRRCGFLVVSRCASLPESPFPLEYTRETPLSTLPLRNLFHVSPSPHFQALSCAFAQLECFYSPEEIFYEAYLQTMNHQRRRGSQAYAWRDVDVSLSVINKQIDTVFLAQICRMFLESRNTVKSRCRSQTDQSDDEEWLVEVEVIEDIVGEDIDTILKDATRRENNNTVLLLNYDTATAHDVVGFGRSAAVIKAYNPDTKSVMLWEAEHSVFGMFWTVDVSKFIEIGDLMNEGRSPHGLVRFERVRQKVAEPQATAGAITASLKDGVPRGGGDAVSGPVALRRNREMMTRFLFSPHSSEDRRRR